MSNILERELETFEKNRKHLEEEHSGKFVLISEDKVIGTYDNFETAADEGLRQFGRTPFLIRRVGETKIELPTALLYGITGANP